MVDDPNSGVGWYEFTTPTATTGIAYVHEGGDVYVPEGGWGPTEPFHLAASRGHVHRLVRADQAAHLELRTAMSTWLTAALSVEPGPSVFDLDSLRGWIDGGCSGDMPMPEGGA